VWIGNFVQVVFVSILAPIMVVVQVVVLEDLQHLVARYIHLHVHHLRLVIILFLLSQQIQ
jgi:hypothetical protein